MRITHWAGLTVHSRESGTDCVFKLNETVNSEGSAVDL